MKYGFILAAGNQTRYKDTTPKALAKIDGRCLLDINIEILEKVCDCVYVVCSHSNKKYFSDKYRSIVIDSGYGSGDALYKVLSTFIFDRTDQIIVCWGDTLLNYKLVAELGGSTTSSLIPCLYEENPYVQFVFNSAMVVLKVLFSKRGDKITPGYHDMSIFLFDAKKLKAALFNFVEKYINKDNSYNCFGGEFELLDIFNEGFIGYLLEVDKDIASKSFNTLEELRNISLN